VVDHYALAFEDAARARVYVHRVAHYLRDVALYVDGPHVLVLDGTGVQREPILRLARESGAAVLRQRPPRPTRPG
jgi:hypothetical protein